MPRVRDDASRTAAKASGRRSSSFFTVLVAGPEPVCFFAQFGISEGLERVFKGVNGIGIVPQLPQGFFVTRTEKFFD